MDIFSRADGVYAFGPFRLDPVRRALLRDGQRVRLTERLFETLLYLVVNHDRLVERDELVGAVWRGRAVEDGSLGQAVFTLRKALQTGSTAEPLIVTVAGRGYRFAVPVVFIPDAVAVPEVPEPGQAEPAAARAAGSRFGGVRHARISLGLLTMAGAACLLLLWRHDPASEVGTAYHPPPHSVAVLAFANMSADRAQDYFSDGLAEELIDSLARIGGIRVAARTSSFAFKGKPATAGDIGRALNVAAVLDGSVRRDGRRLRVTAHLVDATSGYLFWSHSYDRDEGDAFRLQAEIARAVTDSLQVTLLGDEDVKLTLGGTTHADAFDAYLRGMKLKTGDTEAAEHQALLAFEEAIRIDPGYALAHVQRARMLMRLVNTGTVGSAKTEADMTATALTEAKLAALLAPKLGVVHDTMALLLEGNLSDLREADAEYSEALALAPGDAVINMDYAFFQQALGHNQVAVQAAQRASALDPLTPTTYRKLAEVLLFARRYDEALVAMRHAVQVAPDVTPRAAVIIGVAQVLNGDPESGRRTCARARNFLENLCLAFAYQGLGRTREAEAQLALLRAARGDAFAYQYAEIYAYWHRVPEALQALETAYRLQNGSILIMRIDPILDPIRDTPRFKDIERRLNFPP